MKIMRACLILFAVLLVPAIAGAADCLICHSAMKGKIEGRKGAVEVNVDPEKFRNSVHGSFGCTDCHLTYENAHAAPGEQAPEDIAGLLPLVSIKSRIDPVAQSACVRCHPQPYEEYQKSVHGKNIFEEKKADGPICIDCHGPAHYIVPKDQKESWVNHANVLYTCGKCHENKKITEEYGMSEHVIEKYKESFHGKKYVLGHKKVPICNDCHGGHSIVAIEAPDSPVVGEGKVKTCGKCHLGAGRKFAAAPAHKYIGSDNPIPYYSEKFLILLVLGTFGFITSHVILELYSEFRDKLIRKKRGEGGE